MASEVPAILGGRPIFPDGPPAWPPAWEPVAAALRQAWENGSWGTYHGPNVPALSRQLGAYHDVEFVRLCPSGTFAIELALRALRMQPGDEVILSAYDFIGNFNTIVSLGGRPALADVHPDNGNLDPDRIEAAISPATRGILASHLHGGVVPMARLADIARSRGLWVVEDAAQMPGAIIEGRRAGTWGDAGILSFGGSKLLTAGRGGAVLTSCADLYQRMKLYADRGNDAYPLSELQAAVLRPQLEMLDERNRCRAAAVGRLHAALAGVSGLQPLRNAVSAEPGYYKVGFRYDAAVYAGLSRSLFVEAARAEGIALDVGFNAFHHCRSARRFRAAGPLPHADAVHHDMVVLHHPILLGSDDDLQRLIAGLMRIQQAADQLCLLARQRHDRPEETHPSKAD